MNPLGPDAEGAAFGVDSGDSPAGRLERRA